jgi:CDP-diacylglycerol--glycerol-3-phosphate 3-phosphatidyltransferase
VTGSLLSPATRARVRDLAAPIATALGRLGLTPNALTVIGFLGTCVAAFTAASQWWLAAGVLVLAFGIFDLFDGTLARATGRATKLGAFLDSTFDRAGEAVVYLGIAMACLGAGFALGALLSAAALAAALMVSYTRAKAESLGFSPGSGMMYVGLAPREVRMIVLVVGLLATAYQGGLQVIYDRGFGGYQGGYAPFGDNDGSGALALTLGLITFLATFTTIQRVLHVRAQSREG